MKLSSASYNSIAFALRTALKGYISTGVPNVITDFYIQPDWKSGELVIWNDDDDELARVIVKEWVEANPENFYAECEAIVKKVLNQLSSEDVLLGLSVLKPYSFVLVDEEKETVAELLLVDDEETMLLSEDLLKGLDEELDAFLKDLLEK